jgi:tetratricopeptide (TPR) repeat protein
MSASLRGPLPEHLNGRFIGREEETAAFSALLASSRLVTVVGAPGVGKTRMVSALSGGAVLCSLSDVIDESSMYRSLAMALEAPKEKLSSVLDVLKQRAPLLVLDQAERALTPLRAFLLEAHQKTSARFVCTSRERLALPMESIFSLAPLSDSQARELFLARVKEQNVVVDDARLPELLGLLDGLPLAIELAAARAKLFSIPQLIDKLSSRFQLLRRSNQTLERVISSSWDSLSSDEQSVLSQCALFRGSFSIEAAEQIVQLDNPDAWIVDVLQSLCEKSLLFRHGDRLSMMLCIREFSSQLSVVEQGTGNGLTNTGSEEKQLKEPHIRRMLVPGPGLKSGVIERFASYFISEAAKREAQLYGRTGESAKRWFQEEQENLVEVYRLGERLEQPQWSIESALYLSRSFTGDARYETLLSLLGGSLPLSSGGWRAALLEQRGRLFYLQGSLVEALADLSAAATLAEEAEDSSLLASVYNRLGTYYLRTREMEQADQFLQRASSLFEALSPTHHHGFCESQRALLAKKRGQYQLAQTHYERSLAIRQRIQDLPGVATSLLNLSYFLKGQGRLAEARVYVEQVLPIARRLSDQRLEASYLGALGAIHQEDGDLPKAAQLLEESNHKLQTMGKRLLSSWFTLLLGQAYHELGRLTEARQQYEAVLSRRDSAEPAQESYTWSYLAMLCAKEGRQREASDAISLAEKFAKSAQEPVAESVRQVAVVYVESVSQGKKLDAPHEAPLVVSGLLPSVVSWDVRFALRLLHSLSFGLENAKQSAVVLLLEKDARWFELPPAERVNMQQRKAPRLLLLALVEEHKQQKPMSVEALFAKGWPNERAHPDAARSRVYTALNLLRSLGLQDVLLRRDDGYLISKEVTIRIS